MDNSVEQFRNALADAGVILAAGSQIIPDGKLHRCSAAADKSGQRTAWYRLHLDAPVAGAGGDWRTGVSTRWCSKRESSLSAKERAELAARILRERAEAEAETKARHADAAARALRIWTDSVPANPNHPYLTRKNITPGIARMSRGALVLPVQGFGIRNANNLKECRHNCQHGNILYNTDTRFNNFTTTHPFICCNNCRWREYTGWRNVKTPTDRGNIWSSSGNKSC